MQTPIRLGDVDPRLLAGVVEAFGVRMAASPAALTAGIDALVARRAEQVEFPPPEQKDGIRALLRAGGYKPSGRGKPASEYLVAAARKGTFPRISNAVDAANRYSLLTGFPISLIDLGKALCSEGGAGGDGLVIRNGAPGERYVFNPSGQEIDVAGLLCVARDGGGPVGNSVKDSLETRTSEATTSLLAVIWCSTEIVPTDVVERMAAQLGAQLQEHAGAATIASCVLSARPA